MQRADYAAGLTSTGRHSKRLLALGLAAVMVGVLLVVEMAPAGAFALNGCRFDSAQIPSITYKTYSLPSAYLVAIDSGQLNWDAKTGSTTYFVSTTSTDPNIDVYAVASLPGGAWALTSGTCNTITHTWMYDEVRIDFAKSIMDPYSAGNKARIAGHELGHAYGLAHVNTNCVSSPAVMWPSTSMFGCWGSWPWADDVAGWDTIY